MSDNLKSNGLGSHTGGKTGPDKAENANTGTGAASATIKEILSSPEGDKGEDAPVI